MTTRDTVTRSMHDLGLAAWFGGSLMGAVGLNGATGQAHDPAERLRLSALGWARWAPVQVAAVAVHGIGGLGVIRGNRTRLASQSGARQNTAAKFVLTAAAAGLTAWSGIEGRRVAKHEEHGGEGATEPAAGAPAELATAQQRLQIVQWAIPAITGVLVVLGAQQGEQQRSVSAVADRLVSRHL